MKVSTKDLSFGELLYDRKVYFVPIFQRSYAWGKQQILDFWTDLLAIYGNKNSDSGYFIGSIVVTPSEVNVDERVQILDGQQRFATVLLFLAAMREVLGGLDHEGERISYINEILYTGDIVSIVKKAKLELNRDDKAFFEEIIVNQKIPTPRRKSHKLMKKAYTYFRDEITKDIAADKESFIEGILNALKNKFLLIRIEVDSVSNAHMIFETLNDRGLDLSVADLVKNYICSLADDDDLDVVMKNWQDIVEYVGDHNVTRFLRHYWLSAYELVRKEDLYKKMKTAVIEKNVKKSVAELAQESEVYGNLKSPKHEFWNDPSLEETLDELAILRVEQVYSLLLALYARYHTDMTVFKRLLAILIKFSVRYNTVCGLNPNELEHQYSALAVKIRNRETDESGIVAEIRKLAPTSEIFKQNFEGLETKNGKLAKYILVAVNNVLLARQGEKEKATNIGVVNLEHIIPKRPDKAWKQYFNANGIDPEELTHRIGNMTLLLDEYNRKIANHFFDKKKAMYKKSTLPLANQLCQYNEFGAAEVAARQKEIGELAETIWKV